MAERPGGRESRLARPGGAGGRRRLGAAAEHGVRFLRDSAAHPPFGLAWYQGDIETDDQGEGHQSFRGRFSSETFIVAHPPGNQPAPVIHDQGPFPDANSSPATEPIHTLHLGLWFGSPEAAAAAGCANTATRFSGNHDVGIQVMNTSNFPTLAGPLGNLAP